MISGDTPTRSRAAFSARTAAARVAPLSPSGKIQLNSVLWDAYFRLDGCNLNIEIRPNDGGAMIASLDAMIRRIGARPDLPVSGETAERVNSYLHLHYEQCDLSLARISDIFGMSQQYLNQCFKKTYGISIHSMLAEIRLIHAHRLLAAGLPVRDAARQTGWSSPFYFSDRFRRRFGIVPSRVRRGTPGPEVPNGERDGVRFTS